MVNFREKLYWDYKSTVPHGRRVYKEGRTCNVSGCDVIGKQKFDKRIADTVRLLNKIEGVFPASSCGGHSKPKHSGIKIQCPLGTFYIILKIENDEFLNHIHETVDFFNEEEELVRFEYNPEFETWELCSSDIFKDDVLIPLAEAYLKETNKYKPKDDWDLYYSYAAIDPIRIK